MHLRLLAAACFAACVGIAPLARAQTLFPDLAFTPTGAGQRQNFPNSLGLFFTTNAPLTISSFGYWDDNQDGVSSPISVAIYVVGSGTIFSSGGNPAFMEFNGTKGVLMGPSLADQTAAGGGSSGRPGQFRMANLPAPFLLPAGSYALVAWGFHFANQAVNAPSGGSAVDVNTFGGILSFNDSRYGNAPAVMPTNLDSTSPQYLIAAFSPDVVVPEPGTYALAAGSAGLVASWWLRRRKAKTAV